MPDPNHSPIGRTSPRLPASSSDWWTPPNMNSRIENLVPPNVNSYLHNRVPLNDYFLPGYNNPSCAGSESRDSPLASNSQPYMPWSPHTTSEFPSFADPANLLGLPSEVQAADLSISEDWIGDSQFVEFETTPVEAPWNFNNPLEIPQQEAFQPSADADGHAGCTPAAVASGITHASTTDPRTNFCNECGEEFPRKSALDRHARDSQHSPYACTCGGTFSRLDVLDRHVNSFNLRTTFPCPHCSRFSDMGAFTRRDHLIQHLRGYHNIENPGESSTARTQNAGGTAKRKPLSCPHTDCSYHQGPAPASDPRSQLPRARKHFQSRKQYTKHLRDVHDESTYPCRALGCGRIGGKGFARKRDLLKHEIEHHPDDPDEGRNETSGPFVV